MNFGRKHIGIERRMGTQRLPNITSMSIRRPPAHEKAARATFFPYGAGGPEQLFPYGENRFFMKIQCFGQIWRPVLGTFWTHFGVLFWARFVVCGCGCVCVFVCGCQTQSADGPPCWPDPTA